MVNIEHGVNITNTPIPKFDNIDESIDSKTDNPQYANFFIYFCSKQVEDVGGIATNLRSSISLGLGTDSKLELDKLDSFRDEHSRA